MRFGQALAFLMGRDDIPPTPIGTASRLIRKEKRLEREKVGT
jgi:hypothetical protein